jgi:hypothetical protein
MTVTKLPFAYATEYHIPAEGRFPPYVKLLALSVDLRVAFVTVVSLLEYGTTAQLLPLLAALHQATVDAGVGDNVQVTPSVVLAVTFDSTVVAITTPFPPDVLNQKYPDGKVDTFQLIPSADQTPAVDAPKGAATKRVPVYPIVDQVAETGKVVLVQFMPSLLYSAVLPVSGKATHLSVPLATQRKAPAIGKLRAVQVIPSADVMYCPAVNCVAI